MNTSDILNYDRERNYILLMLGAPVIKIELEKSQLDLIISTSLDIFETYSKLTFSLEHLKIIRSEIMVPLAKILLGMIRRRNFVGDIGASEAERLVAEGYDDLNYFKQVLGPSLKKKNN